MKKCGEQSNSMVMSELWQQSIDNTYCKSFFLKEGKYVYIGQAHPRSFLGFNFLKPDTVTGLLLGKYPLKGILGAALETEDRLYLTSQKKCHILDKSTLKTILIYQKEFVVVLTK